MAVLFYLFILVVVCNIVFYLSFSNFLFSKPEKKPNNPVAVSVIICAKNEAENLQQNLPSILQQDYPNFEVILINDASLDETLEVMETFQNENFRISIVNVENNERFYGNKKYALTLGIKKAKHPYLLFTDADCRPNSDQWIKNMAGGFSEKKSLVIGYGGYEKIQNSFLNKLIRFETVLTAIQYLSSAYRNRAYMGVGRNLAYASKEFYQSNGFVSHIKLLSGDDDLFVNQVSTKENTAIVCHPDSFTYSKPKKTWKAWFKQKRRHVSTAHHYKKIQQFKLGFFYLCRFMFWVLGLAVMFTPFWQWGLIALGVHILVQYIVYYRAGKIFNEMDLLWLLPFQEFILVFVQFSIFIVNLVNKPHEWK